MTTTTGSDATDVYALGSNPDETTRLRRQSDELRPQTAELLDRIGPEPGHSAIHLAAARVGSSTCCRRPSRPAGTWSGSTPTRRTLR